MGKKYIWLLFALLLLQSGQAQNIDVKILDAINSPKPMPLDGFCKSVSKSNSIIIAATPVSLAISGFATHNKGMVRNACVIAASSALNFGVTMGLKYAVNRERPFKKYPGIIFNKLGAGDPSFPSGHTSGAFANATALSLAYPKWYVIAPSYLWAGSVAYSRLHLGVHYPTDVIVGIIVGIGSSYLAYKGNIWLTKKYPDFGK